MSDFIYDLLQKIGYNHPLHPILVHMPIGLVVAAFLLCCSAYLFRRSSFATSAYHALAVAFIFFFPSAVMGLLDWQRYFHGAWLTPVKIKLILAPVLLLLLSAGVFIGYRQGTQAKALFALYLLALLAVTGLGFYGGQLTFGGRSPAASAGLAAGQKLYEANCSGCHAHGGNVLAPDMPLRTAPQLQNMNEFVEYLRHPKLPDGSQGIMPAFSRDELSDQDAATLYDYIQRYVAHPEPGSG
ncbi:MAG: DUF2231 domain-containing protein [Gammaproteobacteria bacterium]